VGKSLKRLAETTVWLRAGEIVGGSRLLGWTIGNEREVVLVLNWRFAEALQGKQFSKVSMFERFQLASEPAQALHAVLTSKINPTKAMKVHLDGLQSYVWGDVTSAGDVARARRSRLRAALTDIGKLDGWSVKFDGPLVQVARPTRRVGYWKHVASGVERTRDNDAVADNRKLTSAQESLGSDFQKVDVSGLFA
jgi:hypothetical protein